MSRRGDPSPSVASRSARPARGGVRGATLVEALAALALVALAGGVVAAAAAANLRALRTAITVERLIAFASHELSLAQARGAPAGTEDVTAVLPDLGGVARHLEVSRRADGVATLAVRVSAPAAPPVALWTRMLTAE